jgi:NAD(P)-dependent dehydrogenase (short-subunit alcohol dehydrogenase family)
VERIWNDGRRFSGRVALVAGAGGTPGGAVATGFGREGASVVVGYRSSQAAAEAVAAEIVSAGGAACAAQLDVTDQDSVDRFVAHAYESYGRVDVLVNTAGRLDEADTVRFEAMTAQAATALLMVDVIGTMRMCHAVIPFMRRHGRDVIINFSSTYGPLSRVGRRRLRQRAGAACRRWLGHGRLTRPALVRKDLAASSSGRGTSPVRPPAGCERRTVRPEARAHRKRPAPRRSERGRS